MGLYCLPFRLGHKCSETNPLAYHADVIQRMCLAEAYDFAPKFANFFLLFLKCFSSKEKKDKIYFRTISTFDSKLVFVTVSREVLLKGKAQYI